MLILTNKIYYGRAILILDEAYGPWNHYPPENVKMFVDIKLKTALAAVKGHYI